MIQPLGCLAIQIMQKAILLSEHMTENDLRVTAAICLIVIRLFRRFGGFLRFRRGRALFNQRVIRSIRRTVGLRFKIQRIRGKLLRINCNGHFICILLGYLAVNLAAFTVNFMESPLVVAGLILRVSRIVPFT